MPVTFDIDDDGAALLGCTEPSLAPRASGIVEGGSYPLSVYRSRVGGWSRVGELERRDVRPRLQTLSGQRLLAIGARCRRDADGSAERNAAIHRAGSLLAEFTAGDGVEDVQASGGDIWVSYTDAGTMGDFGRHGWGRLSPEEWVDPVGVSGLVRFDDAGRETYRFSPPADLSVMNDCFALNVWRGLVWTSYHPDFPVVRIDVDGRSLGRLLGVGRVDVLAVDATRLLAYAHRRNRSRGHLARIVAGQLTPAVPIDLVLQGGRSMNDVRSMVGRGPSLHAFTGDAWYRLDISDLDD